MDNIKKQPQKETDTTRKTTQTRTIKVDNLARVEGEGGLWVKIKKEKVVDVKFKIFEPPRFFEAFLRGRRFEEVPDITARICGICPIAYQMSAVHAIEHILGIKTEGNIRELRRLVYCGEWIQSHVLHIFMLHAPDFLGYQSVIDMAKEYPQLVQNALKFKKIGNELMEVLGGRAIHPVNIAVGGFYKMPTPAQLKKLVEPLKWARDIAVEMARTIAEFEFPDFEQSYEYVALKHPDEYPFNEGRLVSSQGLDIDISEYEEYFEEIHIAHSNALHSMIKQRGGYTVGPLARFNLNFEQLSPLVKQVAAELNFLPPCNNPFKSILVRMLETLYACEEALRIIENVELPKDSSVLQVQPRAGVGYGATEAPRGVCWHKYTLDAEGIVQDAKIVPPTSQNQKSIESDLREYITQYIDLPKETLKWQCEQAIRNYDPCISCATHFLNLEIQRI